ncbi:MAG: hypothetical protein ACR2JE_17380 [Acidobacteriaceae bacterium]
MVLKVNVELGLLPEDLLDLLNAGDPVALFTPMERSIEQKAEMKRAADDYSKKIKKEAGRYLSTLKDSPDLEYETPQYESCRMPHLQFWPKFIEWNPRVVQTNLRTQIDAWIESGRGRDTWIETGEIENDRLHCDRESPRYRSEFEVHTRAHLEAPDGACSQQAYIDLNRSLEKFESYATPSVRTKFGQPTIHFSPSGTDIQRYAANPNGQLALWEYLVGLIVLVSDLRFRIAKCRHPKCQTYFFTLATKRPGKKKTHENGLFCSPKHRSEASPNISLGRAQRKQTRKLAEAIAQHLYENDVTPDSLDWKRRRSELLDVLKSKEQDLTVKWFNKANRHLIGARLGALVQAEEENSRMRAGAEKPHMLQGDANP